LSPGLVVDRVVPLQVVAQPDEDSILVGRAVLVGSAGDQRGDLDFGQAGFLRVDESPRDRLR
jgi:hypothetical protein